MSDVTGRGVVGERTGWDWCGWYVWCLRVGRRVSGWGHMQGGGGGDVGDEDLIDGGCYGGVVYASPLGSRILVRGNLFVCRQDTHDPHAARESLHCI